MFRRLIITVLLLTLLAGALSAQIFYPKGWNASSPKLNPKDNWIPPDRYMPDDTAYSDIAVGRAGDQFNYTREKFLPGDERLAILLSSACADEDIVAQVRFGGLPVVNATVGLYRQGGGRVLVGETTTDENGWVIFARQPPGRYDLTASKGGFLLKQRMLDWQPCPDLMPKKSGAVAPLDETAAFLSLNSMTQSYDSGATRQFANIQLAGGREATQVTIRAEAANDSHGAVLLEQIPAELASHVNVLGFEQDYPASISNSTPLVVQWSLPPISAGRWVERQYVLMRPLDGPMTNAYSQPPVLHEGLVNVGARMGDATVKNRTAAHSNSTTSTNASAAAVATGAAMVGPLPMDWVGMAGGGLVAAGLVGAILFFMGRRARREPADSPVVKTEEEWGESPQARG